MVAERTKSSRSVCDDNQLMIRRAKITDNANGHTVVLCECGYGGVGVRLLHECQLETNPPCGPGCQLKRSVAWWGIRDDGSCGCDSYAAQMDAWGPDECFRRIEEIVDHLRESAGKKSLPFLATAARMMVARAIEAAEQEQAHGQKAQAETRAANVGRAQ